MGGVAKGLDGSEMAFQQQAGGLQDVFVIIHHKDAGI